MLEPINKSDLQIAIDHLTGQRLYLHLETTNGAYATHHGEAKMNVGAYIRNAEIQYSRGKVAGEGPYRVGLKLEIGWVYAEGLTHWENDEKGRILIAGHDADGKLAVALQLNPAPFE